MLIKPQQELRGHFYRLWRPVSSFILTNKSGFYSKNLEYFSVYLQFREYKNVEAILYFYVSLLLWTQ